MSVNCRIIDLFTGQGDKFVQRKIKNCIFTIELVTLLVITPGTECH